MRRRSLASLLVSAALLLAAALGVPGGAATASAAAADEPTTEPGKPGTVETWVDVSPPVRTTDLRVVYPDPFRKDVIWLGGVGGVLYSDDAGDTWVDSLRIAARSRTIGGARRGAEGDTDRDSDADDPDVEDTAAGALDTDDPEIEGSESKEDLLDEVTEAAIEELADEFEIDREDVEVLLADELESLITERFGELLTSEEEDAAVAEDVGTLRLDAIDSIASSAAAPAILYAAGSAGVYVTRDDGTTWEARAVPGGRSVGAIAVDPGDPEHVLAATIRGLWESFDGAVTWAEAGPAELKGRAVAGVAWDPVEPDRAAAWTRSVLALTADGGSSWTAREISGASGAGRVRGFCFVGAPAGRIAFIGEAEGFVSDDAGESWWPLPDLPATPTAIAGRPGSELIWAAGTSRLYRVDGGGVAAGWVELADGWATARPRSIATDPHADGDAYAVSSAGVFRWTRATLAELADKELRMLAARFDEDPTIEATIAAAMRHASLDSLLVLDMSKRARLAGALPRVRLYASWRSEDDRSFDGLPFGSRGIDTDDDWRLLVTASWDLSTLGFDRSEATAASLVAPLSVARESMVDRVLATYSQRRAVAIALLRAPERDLRARLGAELKFIELTAELDALTGNWFSKNVRKKDVTLGTKASVASPGRP